MTYSFALGWEAARLYAGPDLVQCDHWDPTDTTRMYSMKHVGTHACDGCCKEFMDDMLPSPD